MQQQAIKNIKLQKRINLISWIVFLTPVATLLYTHVWLWIFEIVLVSNIATISVWLLEIPTSVFADTTGRKLSLTISVSANLLWALCIFLFPTYTWFIIAAVFSALYWSFWSGTWQAFLEENLSVLDKKKEFGKVMSEFMFWENSVGIITPLIAGLTLKYMWDSWYKLLAGLDVIFAWILLFLTLQLKEITPVIIGDFKTMRTKNISTAKEAFHNIYSHKEMRTLLFYRTFWNHVAFLPLIILPVLVTMWMPDWIGGIVMTISALFLSWVYIITPLLSSQIGYKKTWLLATGLQWVLLIICGLLLWTNWWRVAIIFVLFNSLDWLRQPAWNHVLIHNTSWKSLATTRSIIFSVFALWTTLGKQILSWLDARSALILLGTFIIIITFIVSRKMLSLQE